MVTFTGADALELFEEMAATAPLGPACPLRTIVPVAEAPPTTEAGEMVNEWSTAGLTVSTVFFEVAPSVPVIVADVVESTPIVLIVNSADVAPATTVTDAG